MQLQIKLRFLDKKLIISIFIKVPNYLSYLESNNVGLNFKLIVKYKKIFFNSYIYTNSNVKLFILII